ncbi:MAG TPA: hypothetical protein P5056_03895 [Candidatus Paceibacterota bacterium]|nr:hypothetical protein [Candidatus Paceibacterota bacterium]
MYLTERGRLVFTMIIATAASFLAGVNYIYDPKYPILTGLIVGAVTALGLTISFSIYMIIGLAVGCGETKKNMPPRVPVSKQETNKGGCGKPECANCTSCHCKPSPSGKNEDNENCIGCGYRHDHL